MLETVIQKKAKSKTISLSSMEQTFMIKQLIVIQNDKNKLENYQQNKVKIKVLDFYQIMIILKIIID